MRSVGAAPVAPVGALAVVAADESGAGTVAALERRLTRGEHSIADIAVYFFSH